MKVLVMGSGAVGGFFGAALSRAGSDVTFVARGEHLEAIKRSGLRVESKNAGDFTVHAPAIAGPDGSSKVDLILYTVKGYDNDTATEVISPAVGDQTLILTMQNGVGSGDLLGKVFGHDKVLLGLTYIDATRTSPGIVSEFGVKSPDLVFGEQDGRITQRVEAVRDAMHQASIDVTLSNNVVRDLWSKLIYICGLSGMTCVTRFEFPDVIATPETRSLTLTVMEEAQAVAWAKGVDIDADHAQSTLDYFVEIEGRNVSSMQTDLKCGNPIEVGVLNGAVARLGKTVGVPTPVNEFITVCLTPYLNQAMKNRAK